MDGCSGIRICGLCVRGDYFTSDGAFGLKAALQRSLARKTHIMASAVDRDQAIELNDLKAENMRLRRAIAVLSLDKLFLQETVRGSPSLYHE